MDQLKINETVFREALQNNFLEKCRKNQNYSLRAYARFLDTDPSSLSKIIRGQRKPKPATIEKIAQYLDVDVSKFYVSKNEEQTDHFTQVHEDVSAVISDWYHYAIMELTQVSGFVPDFDWIANKLGIRPTEVQIAIERLLRLGLINNSDDKNWTITDNTMVSKNNSITNAAKIKLQKVFLEKSLKALDTIPIEERANFGVTIALNSRNLPRFKKLIREFNKKFSIEADRNKSKNSVYQLTIALFPLTKKNNNGG